MTLNNAYRIYKIHVAAFVQSCKSITIQHSYWFTNHYQRCPGKRCWEFQQCSPPESESHRTAAEHQRNNKTELSDHLKQFRFSQMSNLFGVRHFFTNTKPHNVMKMDMKYSTVSQQRLCVNIQDNDGIMEEAVWTQATNDEKHRLQRYLHSDQALESRKKEWWAYVRTAIDWTHTQTRLIQRDPTNTLGINFTNKNPGGVYLVYSQIP